MMELPKKTWPWIAAIGSGVMLALCFPRYDLGEFAWFWQIPLFLALWFSEPGIRRKTGKPRSRWRRGFALGYVAGLAFFLLNLGWIFELRKVVGSVWAGLGAWVGLAGYLATYFGAWGAFVATVARWDPKVSEARSEAKQQEEAAREKAKQADSRKRLGELALPSGKSGFRFSPADVFGPSLRVLRFAFLAGAAWCGLEWLRGWLFTGFGWNGLGVTLHENLYLVQAADLIGVTGLSFLLVFCNAIWVATIVRISRELIARKRMRPHLDFAVAMALIILFFLYGLTRFSMRPAPGDEESSLPLRALLVQLNTPIDQKWDRAFATEIVRDYQALTLGYVESSEFDLVLWPETALPGRWTDEWVQQYLNEGILRGGDFTLILGIEDFYFDEAGDEVIYNCLAVARGSTEDSQLHRKIHRVPFGEYLPLRKAIPPIEWIAGKLVPLDFSAGTSFEPLTLEDNGVGIVPLICFEDTVGRLARKFVRPGPQLLVNLTNDGWFYESPAALQHLANARFRCIELRRPMARAANTGVSGFIDAYGSLEYPDAQTSTPGHERLRVVQDPLTGNTFTTGTLPATIRISRNPPLTIYAQIGDAFSIGLGLIALTTTIGHAVAPAARARRRAKETSSTD